MSWCSSVTPEKVIRRKGTTGYTQLTIGHNGKMVHGKLVSSCVCVCVFAEPGDKLAGDIFSHLTCPTSKCHK